MSRKDDRKRQDAGRRQKILAYVCAGLIAVIVLLSAYIAYSLREAKRARAGGGIPGTVSCLAQRAGGSFGFASGFRAPHGYASAHSGAYAHGYAFRHCR